MNEKWALGIDLLRWQADRQQAALASVRNRAGMTTAAAGVLLTQLVKLAEAGRWEGSAWHAGALVVALLAAVSALLLAGWIFLSVRFAENPSPGQLLECLRNAQIDAERLHEVVGASLADGYRVNETALSARAARLGWAVVSLIASACLLLFLIATTLLGG